MVFNPDLMELGDGPGDGELPDFTCYWRYPVLVRFSPLEQWNGGDPSTPLPDKEGCLGAMAFQNKGVCGENSRRQPTFSLVSLETNLQKENLNRKA